ncbi:Ig-like domain-containing protein, partial [Spirosoma litoris]
GTYTYTPTTGYSGPDSFTYTACNSAGKCDKATVSITVLPLACEKPTLTVGSPVCNPANGTYSVSFFSSVATITASAGTLSGTIVSGIPVGTNVILTASSGASCANSTTVTSPASCPANPSCSQPQLSVGQPICNGSTYTVAFSLNGAGTVTTSAGTVSGNTVINIPIGTNVVVTATNGSCVSNLSVGSPASCTNACENPAITLGAPICNGSTYSVSFTTVSGATVVASAGTVSGNQVVNVPSGSSLTLTVNTTNGCSAKVVNIPATNCVQAPIATSDINNTRINTPVPGNVLT